MKITIVYDNEANPGLESSWDFSCFIEGKERLLFDTSDNGEKLIYNMKQLNIVPETIDKVIISHNHWDHTGGLKEFSKLSGDAKVFHPISFSKPTEISSGFRKCEIFLALYPFDDFLFVLRFIFALAIYQNLVIEFILL
jgi:metal-dependent hydrolase (beta-lactamase superfamily II)